MRMMKDPDSIGIYRRGELYWLTVQRNGLRQRLSLETSDYAEAVARAREIRNRPKLSAAGGFMHEVDRFLAYKRRRNEFTSASANARFYILRAFAKWVDVPIENVTPTQIQAFYDWKLDAFGPETANGYAMILRSFFGWAASVANIVRRNPVELLELTRAESVGRRLKDFCSEEERDRLIQTTTREDLRFVLFAGFHAGLRKNEIIEARPWWFDLRAGLLHLRTTPTMKFKDREERTIPLTDGFAEFLESYGLHEPYMLRPDVKHGRNRYRYDFTRPFLEHAKAQKLEKVGQTRVTPHIMRHTFASLLVSNGVSLYKVAIWLGDDPRVVERHYARLRPRDPDIQKSFNPNPGAAEGCNS